MNGADPGLADLPGVLRNGRPGAPHILNVSFTGVEGESLFTGLPMLMLSTGSACNSRSGEPSFVLRALGRDSEQAQSSLRFSFGYVTTEADIDQATAAVRGVHAALWNASPARPAAAGTGEQWVGEAGAERLGTWVRIALDAPGGTVREARIQVYGCPHVAAVCSLLQQRLPGRPVEALAAGSPEEEALVVLDLTPPVTVGTVKARYKQLVKRHHPDLNGGDKASEEMFKRINQAYHVIMQSLAP